MMEMWNPPAFVFVWMQMGYEFLSWFGLLRPILPQHCHLSLSIPYDEMPHFDDATLGGHCPTEMTGDGSVAVLLEGDNLTNPDSRTTSNQCEFVEFFCPP